MLQIIVKMNVILLELFSLMWKMKPNLARVGTRFLLFFTKGGV